MPVKPRKFHYAVKLCCDRDESLSSAVLASIEPTMSKEEKKRKKERNMVGIIKPKEKKYQ